MCVPDRCPHEQYLERTRSQFRLLPSPRGPRGTCGTHTHTNRHTQSITDTVLCAHARVIVARVRVVPASVQLFAPPPPERSRRAHKRLHSGAHPSARKPRHQAEARSRSQRACHRCWLLAHASANARPTLSRHLCEIPEIPTGFNHPKSFEHAAYSRQRRRRQQQQRWHHQRVIVIVRSCRRMCVYPAVRLWPPHIPCNICTYINVYTYIYCGCDPRMRAASVRSAL